MDIKLITIDIDKTLIDDNFNIPQSNIDAIKRVAEKGVQVVLNSGRFNPSTRYYTNQLGIKCYVPSLGGAMLQDYEGNILKEYGLSCQTAVGVYDIIRKYDQNTIVFKRDNWYVDIGNNYWYQKEIEATRVVGNMVRIRPFLEQNYPNKMLATSEDKTALEKIAEEVRSNYSKEVDCYPSSARFLEIMPRGINKGTVIQDLAELLSIKTEQVLAIGDYYNDVEMFKAAGHSASPINAPKEIQKMVEYVSPLNNNEGAVAEILNHYFYTKG